MKKFFSLLLALSLALSLTACGGSTDTGDTAADDTTAEPVDLYVFAAASMQESLDQVIELYKAVAPEVTVVATYDSSGTLKTQIQEGADCDVFISAAPKQMNQLDAEGGEENTEGLDLVDSSTGSAVVTSAVSSAAVPPVSVLPPQAVRDRASERARSREKNSFMGDLPFLMIVCSSRLCKSGVKPT